MADLYAGRFRHQLRQVAHHNAKDLRSLAGALLRVSALGEMPIDKTSARWVKPIDGQRLLPILSANPKADVRPTPDNAL